MYKLAINCSTYSTHTFLLFVSFSFFFFHKTIIVLSYQLYTFWFSTKTALQLTNAGATIHGTSKSQMTWSLCFHLTSTSALQVQYSILQLTHLTHTYNKCTHIQTSTHLQKRTTHICKNEPHTQSNTPTHPHTPYLK